jgi:hypothetical protein
VDYGYRCNSITGKCDACSSSDNPNNCYTLGTCQKSCTAPPQPSVYGVKCDPNLGCINCTASDDPNNCYPDTICKKSCGVK